jgi:hypothetical protein
VFASQAPDGTWRKGEPIFASGEAVASSTNAGGPATATKATTTSSSSGTSGTAASSGGKRDIGNSYVFFYDIVEALMVSMGDKQPHLLAPYLPHFERCVAWAEENQLEEVRVFLPRLFRCVVIRCLSHHSTPVACRANVGAPGRVRPGHPPLLGAAGARLAQQSPGQRRRRRLVHRAG